MPHDSTGQAGALSQDVEITEAMVEAGVRAYLAQASHDEMSFRTPAELIFEVLQAALAQKPL